MAQFSVKIIRLNGAVLDENQHNGATAAAVAYDCSGVYVETDY